MGRDAALSLPYGIGMNASEESDDVEVIVRVINGRTDDFEILLDRYRGYVFKIVSGLIPFNEVQELSHEVFIEGYRSLSRFDLRTSFKKWLTGIAIHLCHDYWRKHYRNREIPVSTLTEDHRRLAEQVIDSQAEGVFSRTEAQKDAREILQWAMVGLSAEDRMVITLVHLEGLSIKEAAKLLGWSMINVKVRAHRAREKMRKRISTLVKGDDEDD